VASQPALQCVRILIASPGFPRRDRFDQTEAVVTRRNTAGILKKCFQSSDFPRLGQLALAKQVVWVQRRIS
jgi:hypothetical protein